MLRRSFGSNYKFVLAGNPAAFEGGHGRMLSVGIGFVATKHLFTAVDEILDVRFATVNVSVDPHLAISLGRERRRHYRAGGKGTPVRLER